MPLLGLVAILSLGALFQAVGAVVHPMSGVFGIVLDGRSLRL